MSEQVEGGRRARRRFFSFVAGMALVQAVLFAALAPLLPTFEENYALSKEQLGLLVGVFALGQLIIALPVALLLPRLSVPQFALSSLVLLAVTSAALGLADSYEGLLLTRFVQGMAVAICWASGLAWLVHGAPESGQAERVGLFSGAASAGHALGPVLGAAAVVTSRAGTFVALSGCICALTLAGLRLPGPPTAARPPLRRILGVHGSGGVLGGLWLATMPAVLIGALIVLVPLQFDELGWDAVGIAGVFLIAAILGVVARPFVGRWADRRGLVPAIRRLLLVAAPLTLVLPWLGDPWILAAGVVATVTVYGVLWGPTAALVSGIYREARIAQVLGFSLLQTTIGAGAFVGAAAGGAVAHAAGDAVAAALLALSCLGSALLASRLAGARGGPPVASAPAA